MKKKKEKVSEKECKQHYTNSIQWAAIVQMYDTKTFI